MLEGFFGLRRPLELTDKRGSGKENIRPVLQMFNLYLFTVSRSSAGPQDLISYPWKSIVLMIKPSVGLTVVTSSFMIRFTMVVLPALSRPLSGHQQGNQAFPELFEAHTA